MYVLTVKFSPTATKTYDYLLINPKGVTINNGRPLKKITGISRGGMSWQELTIVDKTRTDILPDWVTAQIVLDEDNRCTTETISAEHLGMLRRKKPTSAPVPKPTPAKPVKPKPTPKPAIKVVPYQERPVPPAVQAVIDRQRQIREETVAMCQRIFYNNK